MKKILLLLVLLSCLTAKSFADNTSYYRPGYTNAPIMYMNGIDVMKLNQDYQNSLKDNDNKYNQTNATVNSTQDVSIKTLKNAHNELAKKNKELEKRVGDLERRIKELDYRIYNLEKSKKR